MLRVAFDGEPRHLLARCGHRPAAIVTSGFALERRDASPEKTDFAAVGGHGFPGAAPLNFDGARLAKFTAAFFQARRQVRSAIRVDRAILRVR